jgi:hypothetical protein
MQLNIIFTPNICSENERKHTKILELYNYLLALNGGALELGEIQNIFQEFLPGVSLDVHVAGPKCNPRTVAMYNAISAFHDFSAVEVKFLEDFIGDRLVPWTEVISNLHRTFRTRPRIWVEFSSRYNKVRIWRDSQATSFPYTVASDAVSAA